MALLERLQILIDADGKGAVREFQKVGATADRELSRVDERTQKMSAGLTTFGATAVTASAVAAVGLGKLAMTASDYGEAISASSVIFEKEAIPALEAYGEAAAEASGLSKTAAVDGVNQFGTFGKAAGLAGDDLVDFSTDLTSLAGDLASFKNTTPQEAIDALGSALRGEAEPLRKYGVLLDDATLKAEAMELGIYSGNGALTTQQKILAANEAIFKQTSDAQGDFARTSDSLANRQRALAAEFDNVKIKIGEGLIPLFETVSGVATGALDAFGALPAGAQSGIGTVAGIGTAALGSAGAVALIAGQAIKAREALTTVGSDGVRSLNNVGKAAKAAGIAAAAITIGFVLDDLGKSETTQEMDKIAAASGDMTDEIITNFSAAGRNTKGFTDNFTHLSDSFVYSGEQFVGVLEDIDRGMGDAYKAKDFDGLRKGITALKEAAADPANAGVKDSIVAVIEDYEGKLGDAAKAEKAKGQADGEATKAQDELTGAIGEGSAATADATLKIKDYGTALDFVKAAQDITAAGASGFAEAIKASSGGLNENLDAAQGVGSAFKDLGAIVGQLPAQYDLGAAAAGKYTDEQNKALDTFQAAGSAVQTQLETLLATGASYEQITLAAAGYEAQLRKQLESVGITGAAQEEYIRLLGLTPEQVSTAIQLSGMEQARAQLAFLQGDLDSLPEEVTSSIYAKVAQNDWVGALEVYKQFKDKQVKVTISAGLTPQAEAALNSVGGTAAFGAGGAGSKYYRRASGGPIPGTGNTDTVPAMLTPGEYVIRKDAAAAIGLPMLERLNKGDKSVVADMGAQVQRFATGGMVESSPTVSQVYRPTMTYADSGRGATPGEMPAQSSGGNVYIESVTTTSVEELPYEMSRAALRMKALL